MKRKFLKGLLTIIILICIIIVLKPISLVKQRNRSTTYSLLTKEMVNITQNGKTFSSQDAVDFSMDYTCKHLRFSVENDIQAGKANCVGYAQLYASVFNAYCKKNGIKASAKPVVGYVKIFSINFCKIAEDIMPTQRLKNFVKDHDFVEISSTDGTFYIDPSIKDVWGISCKTNL